MLAQLEAYECRVCEDPGQFFPPCCPSCQETKTLRVHELRRRGFWFVVSQEVRRFASLVLRVTCSICQVRFTVLPEFALPHKRYVLSEVVTTSERYLLDAPATYESATRVDGRPVFHSTEGASRPRSTVHRWIGFLGSLVLLLGNATGLLADAAPAISPLAEMRPISTMRYRSDVRREVLERAHRLLRVRTALRDALDVEIFPRIATAAAWT